MSTENDATFKEGYAPIAEFFQAMDKGLTRVAGRAMAELQGVESNESEEGPEMASGSAGVRFRSEFDSLASSCLASRFIRLAASLSTSEQLARLMHPPAASTSSPLIPASPHRPALSVLSLSRNARYASTCPCVDLRASMWWRSMHCLSTLLSIVSMHAQRFAAFLCRAVSVPRMRQATPRCVAGGWRAGDAVQHGPQRGPLHWLLLAHHARPPRAHTGGGARSLRCEVPPPASIASPC